MKDERLDPIPAKQVKVEQASLKETIATLIVCGIGPAGFDAANPVADQILALFKIVPDAPVAAPDSGRRDTRTPDEHACSCAPGVCCPIHQPKAPLAVDAEKPDSLVGLECSRCDVKWVGENVGSAQGWARMSDNPWDWHCPDCAKPKPVETIRETLMRIDREEHPETDASKRYQIQRETTARIWLLIQKETPTQYQDSRWGAMGESVEREREAAAAVIEELKERVSHYSMKAEAYGGIVFGCNPALEAAGFPAADGIPKVTIADAVRRMDQDRDSLRAKLDAAEKRVKEFDGRYAESERNRMHNLTTAHAERSRADLAERRLEIARDGISIAKGTAYSSDNLTHGGKIDVMHDVLKETLKRIDGVK